MTYHNVDNLRLEVEADVVGLPNLIRNPDGEKGAWAWVTPVNNTRVSQNTWQSPDGLYFTTTVSQAAYFTTEFLAVTAGKYVAARFDLLSITASHNVKARFEWYNSSKTLLSSSTQTAALSTIATQYVAAVVAPASTAYVKLRLDFYNGVANPSASASVSFNKAMVTYAATNSFATTRTNLVANPSFEVNASSWTAATGTTIARSTAAASLGTASLALTTATLTQSKASSAAMTVSPNTDYKFIASVKGSAAIGVYYGIDWLDSGGVVLSTKTNAPVAYNATTSFTTVSISGTSPAGAVSAKVWVGAPSQPSTTTLYVDAALFGVAAISTYFDGATAGSGSLSYSWTGTANNSTSVETNTSFAYSDPITWNNILGPTHSIDIERGALDVGTLSATILDAMLDPAMSTMVAPGKQIRLRSNLAGTWESVYEGRIDNARVSYDRDTSVITSVKVKTSIFITATDNISVLANQGESRGVQYVADLPYLLEGKGVPWMMDYETGQVNTATVVSQNDNASMLDQIALTRDTEQGYAWVDRRNIINCYPGNDMPFEDNSVSLYEQSFEAGTDGWNGSQTTVASNSTQHYDGTKSIAITATVANAAATYSPYFNVFANDFVSANVTSKAATIARTVQVGIAFYKADNTYISTSPITSTANSTTAWTAHQTQTTVPSNAVKARIWFYPQAVAAGEVHYVDYVWMNSEASMAFADDAAVPYPQYPWDYDGYTKIDAGFNTDDVINQVIVNWLRTDPETGEADTVVYGPYSDSTSIAAYGARQATFTIHGAVESSSAIATFATNVLTANKTPVRKPHSVVMPVKNANSMAHATQLDLYSLVGVKFSTVVNGVYRITSMKHSINTDSWDVEYGFGVDGQVASPSKQPNPSNTDITDGTWIAPTLTGSWVNYGAPFATTAYMRKNGMVYLKGLVRAGTVGTATPVFTLPAGYRSAESRIFGAVDGTNTANARITMTAAGAVAVESGNNGFVSLDGISFLAEQ